jgi:aspartokinase-like uncharacterized kinase
MAWPSVVVKVGGSLYDLPDLATRLRRFLDTLPVSEVLLVPGGGATAEVVRALDQRHQLGEEKAHWLALRALTFNAHFLMELLPDAAIVHAAAQFRPRPNNGPAILDALGFLRWDEDAHPAHRLPHSWDVTSDAVAARVAVWAGAGRLILLKSTTIPPDIDWAEAARRGYVDPVLPDVLDRAQRPLTVEAVNLRRWERSV